MVVCERLVKRRKLNEEIHNKSIPALPVQEQRGISSHTFTVTPKARETL
jgi:hypothetical protein